jgi:predicted membrane channel-forming protein YqfA (hemolysin III family)
MILGIIVLIVLGALTIYATKDDIFGFDEFLAFIVILISGLVFVASCVFYSMFQPTQTITTENKIYTLETAVNSEGSFCLGSGSIDGTSYYYYYTKDENGLYELKKVKTDDCKLRLTDNETPKIIERREVPEPNVNWFFCTGKPWNLCSDYEYELVVPTNTIQINSFNGMVN